MVDKIVNPAAAANAYATMGKGVNAVAGNEKDGNSFGDIMKTMAQKTVGTIRAGEEASAKAVAGEASLPEVVQAITASEVTLQTVVAMRDKMVTAYQEILRMPV